MEKNFKDRRNNGRNFRTRRNDGRNVKIDKRNHERNSRTNKDNEEQRNVISELQEQLNEVFLKGLVISKEKLEDDEVGRSKLAIEFDSIKLN